MFLLAEETAPPLLCIYPFILGAEPRGILDKLVKITDAGKEFVGKYYTEGYAYKGAKVSMKIDEERIDDREWLSELIQITASQLPLPKKKKKANLYECHF